MSNNNNRMIVFTSILGAILATGLIALNPSMVANAGAQLYEDQYGYDNHPKESSNINVQKFKCIINNININGIDVTEIPQSVLATAQVANEGGEATSTQNDNGIGDRINFDRNQVNVCNNDNQNLQIRISVPDEEEPPTGTATLTVKKRSMVVMISYQVLRQAG